MLWATLPVTTRVSSRVVAFDRTLVMILAPVISGAEYNFVAINLVPGGVATFTRMDVVYEGPSRPRPSAPSAHSKGSQFSSALVLVDLSRSATS